MTEIRPLQAIGIFRVFGCLRPGYLKVEYVDHVPPVKREPRTVCILDDLWIDEVPVDLIPEHLRMPNSEIEVTVEERVRVIDVKPVSGRTH